LFTDGTTLDANAIKALRHRIALPATTSVTRATLAGWTWVVTDPQALTVTLPEPQGNFPELMTGAGSNLCTIPSPTAVAKYGKPYGTGPRFAVGTRLRVHGMNFGQLLHPHKNPELLHRRIQCQKTVATGATGERWGCSHERRPSVARISRLI
jgi:hypothetical protein